MQDLVRQPTQGNSGIVDGPKDIIISIANHFEPKVKTRGLQGGVARLVEWCQALEKIPTRDFDGYPFKHTYFFPAEQYQPELLAPLEEHCRKNFGEVEIHLHHGIETPDTASNLKRP